MTELSAGVYETIISPLVRAQISRHEPEFIEKREISSSDLPSHVGRFVGDFVERLLLGAPEAERLPMLSTIVSTLEAIAKGAGDTDFELPALPPEQLLQIARRNIDGSPLEIKYPLLGLTETVLLTNSHGEPGIWQQLIAEIDSSDQIDIIMAFVRVSGIRPLLDPLRSAIVRGVTVRLITTTYTGSTEKAALDALTAIGVLVKISYDVGSTRLHAKAWHFMRESGFSTVYVGSSNLTHQAQVTGVEWNVRASGKKDPLLARKFEGVFESYWASGDYLDYDEDQFASELKRQSQGGGGELFLLPGIELRLEPFQERLLEQIAIARLQGQHRNLLVSATGTGKTVMAAVDYSRLRESLGECRLLFVAHREEILNQSLALFRYAISDASFGEKWVGKDKPEKYAHVFASVQTLNNAPIETIDPAYFDVIIIDEFHHSAAPSYQRILDHFKPVELLGMTATPERTDGVSILKWFGGEISAELRLWDAIDQGRLAPFTYYGIHDGLDLKDIPWKRGLGYDTQSLTNIFTSTDAWARLVVRQSIAHVPNVATMRGLGFCVSVAHAQFMAHHFSNAGIASVAVHGATEKAEREAALRDLRDGKIKIVFSVDVFNEGVDVPTVDTLLMLRPTESATLFLQQLGRGLRRSPGKTVCTVLDFVGSHRAEFRFDLRFGALLGTNRRGLVDAVSRDFPLLPAGCYLHLDQVSKEIILRSLKSAIPSQWKSKVEELRKAVVDGDCSLREFLRFSGLAISDIYDGQGSHSWSTLREDAGLRVLPAGPHEVALRRAIGRMLHIDDPMRTRFYRKLFAQPSLLFTFEVDSKEHRLARMLVASLFGASLQLGAQLTDAVLLIESHPQVVAELVELLDLLGGESAHLPLAMTTNPNVPLSVHSRYTRTEILAAFGDGEASSAQVPTHREGVKWVEKEKADIFLITIDKADGAYSATTSYRDYAVSPTLFHWESQSRTTASSPTGLRYQRHETQGSTVHFFLRQNNSDRAFLYLGTGSYLRHHGERPMAITWKLATPLPGDVFASSSIAVA